MRDFSNLLRFICPQLLGTARCKGPPEVVFVVGCLPSPISAEPAVMYIINKSNYRHFSGWSLDILHSCVFELHLSRSSGSCWSRSDWNNLKWLEQFCVFWWFAERKQSLFSCLAFPELWQCWALQLDKVQIPEQVSEQTRTKQSKTKDKYWLSVCLRGMHWAMEQPSSINCSHSPLFRT